MVEAMSMRESLLRELRECASLVGVGSWRGQVHGKGIGLGMLLNRAFVCEREWERKWENERERESQVDEIVGMGENWMRYAILSFVLMSPNWG